MLFEDQKDQRGQSTLLPERAKGSNKVLCPLRYATIDAEPKYSDPFDLGAKYSDPFDPDPFDLGAKYSDPFDPVESG